MYGIFRFRKNISYNHKRSSQSSQFTSFKESFTRGCCRLAFQYLSHNFNEIPGSVAVSEFQSSINNGSALSVGGCRECMHRQYFIFPRSRNAVKAAFAGKKRKYSETENSAHGKVCGCRWKFPEDNRNFSLKIAHVACTRVARADVWEKLKFIRQYLYRKISKTKSKLKTVILLASKGLRFLILLVLNNSTFQYIIIVRCNVTKN